MPIQIISNIYAYLKVYMLLCKTLISLWCNLMWRLFDCYNKYNVYKGEGGPPPIKTAQRLPAWKQQTCWQIFKVWAAAEYKRKYVWRKRQRVLSLKCEGFFCLHYLQDASNPTKCIFYLIYSYTAFKTSKYFCFILRFFFWWGGFTCLRRGGIFFKPSHFIFMANRRN